jgi:pimeloyl-ACP methyl ester carboxylesterase
MSFAGMYPDRVNRLVIEDIGPEVPPEGSARVRARLGGMPTHFDSIGDLVAYNRQSKVNASDAWMTYLAELSTRPTLDGRRELKYRPRPLKPGETAPQSQINTWDVISHITAPTLIVRGEESDILNEDITNRMLAVIKDSRAVAIPRAGHVVHEDNPDDYITQVAAFLGVA